MRLDQIVLLRRIVAKVEELSSGFTATVDHELVAVAEHGTGAGEILFLDFRMMEVLKIARGESARAEFRQRSRAFLKFQIDIGPTLCGSLPLLAAVPKPDRA